MWREVRRTLRPPLIFELKCKRATTRWKKTNTDGTQSLHTQVTDAKVKKRLTKKNTTDRDYRRNKTQAASLRLGSISIDYLFCASVVVYAVTSWEPCIDRPRRRGGGGVRYNTSTDCLYDALRVTNKPASVVANGDHWTIERGNSKRHKHRWRAASICRDCNILI